MKHELNYVSPEINELSLEQESVLCASTPFNGGGLDDYYYEVLPEA